MNKPKQEQQMQKDHLVGGDGGGVQSPKNPPNLHEYVLVLTTDCDDDPTWSLATYNGEKIGYLGDRGHRVKPVTAWFRLPPKVAA